MSKIRIFLKFYFSYLRFFLEIMMDLFWSTKMQYNKF
jgi:hypothetical protein